MSIEVGAFNSYYIVGDNCFIERKTVADFITSVADRRLFRQVYRLAYICKHPLLILEGGDLHTQNRIPANVVYGLLIWVTMTQKVPVIRTRDEHETACVLRLLAKRYLSTQSVSTENFKRKRRTVSPWQQQLNVLTQVPGFGRQTAQELLTSFGSLTEMVSAPDSVLVHVPHVGKERIRRIRQLFPKSQKPALVSWEDL